MLNSKQIGNITEIECMLSFIKLGYNVLTPYGDCERYDFVADIDGKLIKVQVKHACDSNIQDGYITFRCVNKTTQNGSFVNHKYTKEQIDYFATYYDDKCYLVPVEEVGSSVKTLRFRPPANSQVKGITFASEYELEKVVKKITDE